MDIKRFVQSVQRIYTTSSNEIDCEQFQLLLAQYVDKEIARGDAAQCFPSAYSHILQCPDCAEDYNSLLQVARLQAQGGLPRAEESLQTFETETTSDESEITPVTTR